MANNQQNVLVKLSAEGEEQVVAAFDKMAEAAKNRGKETEGSLASVKEAAAELGKTLAGLFALERVVDGFKEMVAGAIETGETLQHLHQQTGISTDSLQAYAYAAKMAGVDQEAMTQGMTRLARSIYQAQNGSKQAADALSAIGLSVKDFVGLTPEQQFDKVAKAIGGMEDKTKQQAVAMALMGRGGAQLARVFSEVAEQGLGSYIEKMKQLGIYQSPEMIQSFTEVADRMKELKGEVHGLATQFASGLAPAISQAMESLMKATTGPGIDGFKTLGEYIGTVIKTIILGLETIGTAIGVTAGEIVNDFTAAFDAVGQAWEKVKNKDFSGAASSLGGIWGSIKQNDKAAEEQFLSTMSANYDALFKDEAKKKEDKGPTGLSDADPNSSHAVQQALAIAKAKEALIEQQLQNELALYKAHASLLEKTEKEGYDAGRVSLEQYYEVRRQIIIDSTSKEIETLKARYAARAAMPTDADNPAKAIEQKTALAKLQGEIDAKEIERNAQLAQLTDQQRAAEKAVYDAHIRAEEQLLTLQGKRVEAQRLQLQLHLEELDRTLRAGGTSDADRTAAVGTASAQGNAAIDFAEKSKEAQVSLKGLNQQITAIKQAQADGQLFPVQAEQQIIDLEKQRVPVLQAIADQMMVQAKLSDDPAKIEQAQAFQLQINNIKNSTDQAGLEMAKLKATAQDTFVNGMSNALMQVINHSKSLGDAFRNMGFQMVQALEQAIIKMLIMKALQAATGFSGGGSVGGAGVKLAGGGFVPGSGHGDTVPAMLTPGEFVITKEAMAKPGMQTLMEAVNGGAMRGKSGPAGVPHYAAGGMVAGAAASHSTKIVNVLDPSTLGDHLATAAGERAVINIMARNPNQIREALG